MAAHQIPDTGLPVEAVVGELRAALGAAGPGHAVVVAPPGAGKTTVLPLRLLGEPWLGDRRIVVLEPRRLAARAAARRMAELVGEEPGGTVGYRTRDERVVGRRTRIEVITEGILVRRLQADPTLPGTGLVVLDEVHERNLVTDLSLALLLDARRGLRPALRVVAMSATVDADRLATLIGGAGGPPAPVVRSAGRQHPVAVHHHRPGPRDRVDAHAARVVASVVAADPDGDVLVFLPGAADIRRVADRLRPPGALPPTVDVRPLFGALPTADQDAALAPSAPGRRRVVLATDIAESSLTVPGVHVVVDAGLVRVPRFDPGTGLTRLRTETASRAAGDQRAGRAGRLGPGQAHRLWDAADHARRPAFPVPEIEVVDLAGFALEVAVWGTTPERLDLLDPPPAAALAEAAALLRRLDALDEAGRVTAQGRAMADLPVHPRLARLVLVAAERGVGWTGAVLAALLEERDVLRGRPGEVTADLTERVALVDGRRDDHPDLDRSALRTVRRRARELARRLGVGTGRADPDAIGALVAAAYPDRIAQAGGRGRFRLRDGGGGRLAGADPLVAAAWLAVAALHPDGADARIATAAELERSEVLAAVGTDVDEQHDLEWDVQRDDLRARTTRRAGALVLGEVDGPAPPGEATVAALVARVVATDGELLRWTPAARSLQSRAMFLQRLHPDRWPAVDDATLLATATSWLAPLLPGATSRREVERLDICAILRDRIGIDRRNELDRLAPTTFATAAGRELAITYDDGRPTTRTRVQDLFGTTRHPTVADGTVPVVVELLSPAGRPVQVTADLAGFWTGSWSDVRKDLAGRYPKHPWPASPTVADASRRRPSRR